MKFLIGCDPEIFLLNPNSGQFVSAEGLIPGDKLNPFKVKKGTIQVDGFAAEIGTDPASDPNEFADNVETVLDELRSRIPGYKLVFQDSVIFDEKVFLGQSDKGRELGCEPDYSAHTRMPNNPPVPNPKEFRTASGHIHIGFCEDEDITSPGHFADCCTVSKQMDWVLGCPSVLMNPGSKRRALYGKAGAFRPKSYGVEYRTPDNSWLVSRERMIYMFNNAIKGMNDLMNGKNYVDQYQSRNFIDRSDARSIPDYLNALGIPLPPKAEKKKVA